MSGLNDIKFAQDISTRSGNARPSYVLFNQFSRPCFSGAILNRLFLRVEGGATYIEFGEEMEQT